MILRQAQGIRRRHAGRDNVAASRAAAVVPHGRTFVFVKTSPDRMARQARQINRACKIKAQPGELFW